MEPITVLIILGVAVGTAILITSCDNARRIKDVEDKTSNEQQIDRKWR